MTTDTISPLAERHAAFISYASRYADWVATASMRCRRAIMTRPRSCSTASPTASRTRRSSSPRGRSAIARRAAFDEAARRRFLARWFGRHDGEPDTERAAGALARLAADPGLWELSGNPLYLTLMAMLVERDRPLARRRAQLDDEVLDLLPPSIKPQMETQ